MKTNRNKILVIAISLLLAISMVASVALMPKAAAHTPAWTYPTIAYLAAEPNLVGVGQSILIYAFTASGPIPNSAIPNTYRYHNYDVTVTAPSGTPTKFHYDTIQDTTGVQGISYTPTEVGVYNVTFNYAGQTFTANDQPSTSLYLNDSFAPASATVTFTVQQTAVPTSPVEVSYFPTSWWTRPIYGENPMWYSIASNWLGTGSPVSSSVGSGVLSGFPAGSTLERNPGDAVGSLTSHIMWTTPMEIGGVVGDNQSYIYGNTYFEGSAYSQRWTNPIVVAGILIYNPPISFTGSNSGPTTAQDLRTGKILWQSTYLPNSVPIASGPPNNVPAISFAYVYDVQDPNQHGTYPPILFSSNFAMAFNAFTGNWLFNVTGVPTGSIAQGPQGEQLRYVIANGGNSTNPHWTLAEWNSSKLWTYSGLSPAADTSSVSVTTGNKYTYNYYYTPTYTNVTTYTYVNNVLTTEVLNYTANTAAINASVWQTIDPTSTTPNTPNPHLRFDWNVSLPWLDVMGNQTITAVNNATGIYYIKGYQASPTTNPDASNPSSAVYALYNNMLICRNGSLPSLVGSQAPYTYFAVDLNPAHSTLGQILWMQTETPPSGSHTLSSGPIDPIAGVFTEGVKETTQWIGYSMQTGAKLWTTNGQEPLDYFGNPIYPYITGQTAYGMLYSAGQAGVMYAYDMKTGQIVWKYGNGGSGNSTQSWFQGPGNYPTEINAVGNGVLYLVTTEHTVETPIYKGAMARAVNATTGQELWTLSDYTGEFGAVSYAIADGCSIFYNGYDDQIYNLGQGPSATTVTAPSSGLTFGQPVVIKGTVMDISAGAQQTEQAANFANGLPVASDASMTAWMGYVYQQQPMPTNFTGVPVSIQVVDSNGNFRSIGTATTDSTGSYNLLWTPDISGSYQVIATFQGTKGYWGSYATTAFDVMPAAPTASPYPVTTLPPTETYIAEAAIAIIIAIAIAVVVIVLMLRKRA